MSRNVTVKVRVASGRNGRKRLAPAPDVPAEPKAEQPERVPRVARLLALAHHWNGLLRDGTVRDRADLARLVGVSRARITQVMRLMDLAPDIQEAVLDGKVDGPGAEKALRAIAEGPTWSAQTARLQRRAGIDYTPDMDLEDLLTASEIEARPAARTEAIAAAERRLGTRLPEDYRELLLHSNGLSGFVSTDTFYLSLYSVEELPQFQYEPNIVPGLVVIGSDGGGEAFGFIWQEDGSALYVRVPFIGGSEEVMDRLSPSFKGFIERLRANDFV